MNATAPQPYFETYRLKVSAYDRASGMLIALLILLGLAVMLLLIIWLGGRILASQPDKLYPQVEIGEGDDVKAGGMELQGPTIEEMVEETDLEETKIEDTLAAIADAVGAKMAVLARPRGGSSGQGRGVGSGGGIGTRRHWEVHFKGNTLAVYAKQLDFFGIELGVLMPANKVIYAYNLSKSNPDVRSGAADAEKRYYLIWRGGELQEADRALLEKAGVDCQRWIIIKFLPPPVEARLAQLERNHAGRTPGQIRKTMFGVRAEGSGYAFFILDQWAR